MSLKHLKGTGAHDIPARGYSWPQATPGNQIALKHGARSPRVVEPIARELVAATLAERADLRPFPFAVAAWADAEARVALLREWLGREGMFDKDGSPRDGALSWLTVFERRAEAGRKRLGLDPLASAELARQRVEAARTAIDLDGRRARGAAIVEAREGAAEVRSADAGTAAGAMEAAAAGEGSDAGA